MLVKSLFVSTVSAVFALGLAACGAPSSSESLDHTGQASTKQQPDLLACEADADCVAVPQAGCCNNGWLYAVNASYVETYAELNACAAPIICPHYVVNDTRTAHCGASAKCELVGVPAPIATDDDAGATDTGDTTAN